MLQKKPKEQQERDKLVELARLLSTKYDSIFIHCQKSQKVTVKNGFQRAAVNVPLYIIHSECPLSYYLHAYTHIYTSGDLCSAVSRAMVTAGETKGPLICIGLFGGTAA